MRRYSACPTQHIRWHYVDIRFMVHSMEGSLFHPFRYYLNTLRHQYETRIKRVEHTRSRYSSNGINELVLSYIESYRTDLECSFQECEAIQPHTKASPFVQQLVSLAFVRGQTGEHVTRALNELYWKVLSQQETAEWKSMILKQIRNIPMSPFHDLAFWKELMVDRLLHDPLYLRSAEAWVQAVSSLQEKDHAYLSSFFLGMADASLPSLDYDYVMNRMEWMNSSCFFM